ncbi:phosphatase PAP2 family protein [Natronorarus salvus]|uniref:phosphatase PAP2 family protein n=1 Tax=Natronorarus salvus TaxID=3117733 RepID=UPI002F263B5A
MSREGRDLPSPLWDPEVNRAIQEALPELAIDAFGLVTHFGDGATLVGLVVVLYWFGAEEDRQKRAMVLAVAVATLALVAGLKGILEVQRPLYAADPVLPFAPETYSGWSTPSAHAMGAAAVYPALAVVIDVGTRRARYTVAGVMVVAVSGSRVVLGLHYVGDVLVGALLGLLLVAIALRITTTSVTPMFGLSLAIALAAFALGSEEFTEMAIGASAGGLVVWHSLEGRESNPLGASMLLVGLVVLPTLVLVRLLDALIAVEETIAIALGGALSVEVVTILQTVGYAAVFGAALAVPFVATALNDLEVVRSLQRRLPFEGRTVDPEAVDERTR